MAFHAYTRPADYVYLFPTARSFIYGDADRIAGNVVIQPSYQGLIREKGSNRLDGAAVYNAFTLGLGPRCLPDAGPYGAGWETNNQSWGVTGGLIYLSAPLTYTITVASLFIPDNGYDHNDVSVDVSATTGIAGVTHHLQSDTRMIATYLDTATSRIKAATVNGSFVETVLFTGSTVLSNGTTYRLRVAEASNGVVSVYLNGSLEGTYNLTGVTIAGQSVLTMRGVGMMMTETSARFSNFYVAPQAAMSATDFAVRNYDGDVVYTATIASLADPTQITIPDSSLKQRSNRGPYGWYRMYLTGPDHGDGQWGTAYGDCAFCRVPTVAAGFAANALINQGAPGFSDQGIDEYARGVMGLGTARYNLSNDAPIATANAANSEIFVGAPILKAGWVDNAHSLRPRRIIGAFADGTAGVEASVVAPTVTALMGSIKAWETLNEPNFFMTPADFVNNELAPFYNAVKAVDPDAWVLAPGNVSFGDSNIGYLSSFLLEGGGDYCDAISVHAYNCFNGDMALARRSLGLVETWTTFYGVQDKPRYQTEQGFAWEYAGLIYPRYAGRWTAHMWFMSELYGLPVENNSYWYDSPIGFDQFPMYWTSQTGIGPQPVPIRTMVAEIGNRTLTAQFDFGTFGNDLYAGGTWTAGDGSKTVGLMATSYGQRDVTLTVSGTSSLTCVDTWGNTFALAVTGGLATFPISEMPQWVRCPVGVTVTPTSLGLTTNLALTATVTSDGAAQAGDNGAPLFQTYAGSSNTDVTVMNNDVQENQYAGGEPLGHRPYEIIAPVLPLTITLTWGAPVTTNRVIVYSFSPWQFHGVPTAFHIDTWDGSSWTTRYTKTAPTVKSFAFTSAAARCTFETYCDEQWVFDASFAAVSTSEIRVVITDATTGSGEPGAYDALWGAWNNGTPKVINVREIQAFNVSGAPVTFATAGVATGTGTANTPARTFSVRSIGGATGTGAATNATAAQANVTNAPAGVVTGTGAAYNATVISIGGASGGTKISDLTALAGVDLADVDEFVVVDKSDTSMAGTGTDKKVLMSELFVAITERQIVHEFSGVGSPNGEVFGSVGDRYWRLDGGAGTTLYVKESGTDTNTGWVGK